MPITKKRVLTFFLLSSVFFGSSQIKGKITDLDNNTHLQAVSIINLENKMVYVSDDDGAFEVSERGVYLFEKPGYISKTTELKTNAYYIIQLQINTSELNEIVINAYNVPKKIKQSIASIHIISNEDIERGNDINIVNILNRTPGVFMQSGALNTNRISIRGVGSRNLFGTAKIRAYFGDIPLTSGNGETTIEDFELNSISRLEIIKGSSSSTYGAGLGGTIHIMPKNGYLNQSEIYSKFSIGSFGLTKASINVNHGTSSNGFRAIYSNTQSNGYRDNNQYNRQTFTIHSNHFLDNKNELTFLASYVDLMAFIPSSVDEETYLNNPKKAAFTWQQSKGFEDAQRAVFGLSWKHQYNTIVKHITSVFTSFRNAYEPRPFNILTEHTLALGIRTRLLGDYKLFNKKMSWTLGGEFFNDFYKYKTFENLYEDFPEGTGSVKGNQLSNFKEKRNYFNGFLETNYELSEKTNLSLGLNFNQTSYHLDDKFPISSSNPDQSGAFKFKSIFSPKIGISQILSKHLNIYSNVSHGFSPLTLTETLLPDGQINTDLKPETGWNFELGMRGSAINNKLQFSLALYRLSIKNLLVSRRTAEDEFIGINAGKTRHDGIELSMNYLWIEKTNISISSFITYTLNKYTFRDYMDGDNEYSGNKLTGVPSDVFNAGLIMDSKSGLYGNINFQYVGAMPITDSNARFSDSYSLTNLKVGYKTDLAKKLELNLFFGLNNSFDTAYASQILINASGFNGSAPRYYYPGNPINYYTGLNLNYMF
ncbi:iron complex outermembrane receptor protein [Flavobacteriaceae bacterium MAR_2010_72]|nr:iron complex outermembrane receptor protein [Flavobacteriaceae bacterium MAR_2010_72]